jgi:predicted metalloprotease with PDZ domain
MKYTLSFDQPHTHYLSLQLSVETRGEAHLHFQLPAWRPGRYELGNFAKNIQKWQAFSAEGSPLSFRKKTKDLWEVDCEGTESVEIRYNYYAAELNAGSTYLDSEQLYVNPVNCFLYLPDRQEEACFLKLQLPQEYKVAIALPQEEERQFKAENFDQLADSPFIASPTLKQLSYKVEETTFYLWFQGECKLPEERLLQDFEAFTKEQIKFFGDFPTSAYHFLFQIHTSTTYHGVEHAASTVISIGPSYQIFDWKGRYEDLLGVSSHELFHTWNVKRIRPVEMWPYDFAKENYSRLGYLAEGATTWYGDLMLWRSKVFKEAHFFKTFNQLLNRHFNNPGVSNLSVADSSFDTWLDGYSMGVPNRKSSIYTEGALITFMLDVAIRKATDQQKSFDDVMRVFYHDYFKATKGISEADYQNEVEKAAGKSIQDFFNDYVNGAGEIEEVLKNALDYFGLSYSRSALEAYHESYLGFKMLEGKVAMIYPNSVAEKAGLQLGDEILSLNGIQLDDNLAEWCRYFEGETLEFTVANARKQIKQLKMKASESLYFANYQISKQEKPTKAQQAAYKAWYLS